MKQIIFSVLFVGLLFTSVTPQGFVTWYSLESFVNYYDDLEIMVPYSERFTRVLPNVSFVTSDTDYSNFSFLVLEGLDYFKVTDFTYTADPSTNTIITVGGLISANVSFNWLDQEPWEIYPSTGEGWAVINTTQVIFNKTLAYDGAPNTTVSLAAEWGDWDLNIDDFDPVVVDRVTQAINQALTDTFGEIIISNVENVLNQRYQVVYLNWGYAAKYEYGRNAVAYDNSIFLLELTQDHLITSRNGSLIGFQTSEFPTNAFDVEKQQVQVAITREVLQNFVQYTALNNFYHFHLTADNYPINGFNYTIKDLSNFYPAILQSFPAKTSIFLTCYADPYNAPNLTLNVESNAIETVFTIQCSVLTNDVNQSLVFAFNFTTKLINSVKFTELGESVVTFVGANLIGNVGSGVFVTPNQQTLLNYQVLNGLQSLIDTISTWGTYYYFSIVDAKVNVTNDYIYLYGDYVPPVINAGQMLKDQIFEEIIA